MNKREILVENYPDEELLCYDGFDDAIIGVTYNKPTSTFVVCYSRAKSIEIIVKNIKETNESSDEEKLTDDEILEQAIDHFEFNVDGGYVGNKTPIFVDDEIFEMYAE
jgi:hypothetical protein